MNGPVLDPDKEESTMEALGMIETRGLVALMIRLEINDRE